ncbi:MAG TPA: orotidine-5'-phosphate decarboxylase [Candidatus Gracilibacteria bacterium]|nr:orotidine-5'-phosphate decarboxylase [Candidatus Gracilibacteria bacterium]
MATKKVSEKAPRKVKDDKQERRQPRNEKDQLPFHFADRLNDRIRQKGSAICVGLDPDLKRIPGFIKKNHFSKYKNGFTAAAESILEFNKGIIDAVQDLVPVVKPQIAYYEEYGHEGIRVFEETLWYARDKGLMTIADIKRGDIGSTAEAYARAFLGKVDLHGKEVFSFDADAVTVAPYLGWDGIKPFVDIARKHGKGVFVLVKTSNPSSADLQDLEMKDASAIYEIMAQYLDSWGADDLGTSDYSLVGAVVGATFPKQAMRLRKLMPRSIFLVPGYGTQGGTADDVKVCFGPDGLGAIINSSRAINYAWEQSDHFTERDYAEAARDAVMQMKSALKGIGLKR